MSIKVGITGGIGSGKTTVCKVFQMLGAPVFEADLEAKVLLDNNSTIKKGLIELFGDGIFTDNGLVDRKKLATLIFNNDVYLAAVNSLIHPQVRDRFLEWTSERKEPYVMYEAAILFESGFHRMMDFSVLVTAPELVRVNRIINRSGMDRKEITARMQKQWDDEKKRQLADAEIINDDVQMIIPRIIEMDYRLKRYGKVW